MYIDEVLKTFHAISGMTVGIYDTQFRCTHSVLETVAFCNLIQKSKTCMAKCIQSDKDALGRVAETGEPYIYSCPFGLFEAIYPIREQDAIISYLIVGPAFRRESDTEEFPIAQALEIDPSLNRETLRIGINEVHGYSKEELDGFCRTLSIFAEYIESNHLLSGNQHSLGQLIKQYVRKNLGNKITLRGMSQNLHCSTVTLTESFRREYGMTIMQYVLEQRMKMAEQLLLANTVTVTEIAERCGFPDVEYFSKCFKETHGAPPSVWRRDILSREGNGQPQR